MSRLKIEYWRAVCNRCGAQSALYKKQGLPSGWKMVWIPKEVGKTTMIPIDLCPKCQ